MYRTSSARTLRARRPALAAAALAAGLALTGCQVNEGPRPVETPSVSPEEVTPVPTPDDLGAVAIVDVSPGGPQETDPVWSGLGQAAADGQPAYLSAWVHTYDEIADSGEVTLTPDTPDSVSITVDAAAVDSSLAPMHRIVGTFGVEEIGSSAYALTLEDDAADDALEPKSPDDAARCTADDANDRIQAAAVTLADAFRDDDAAAREEMRLAWGGSPAVWWGIQRTAIDLAASDGESAGDFLLEACEPYLAGDPAAVEDTDPETSPTPEG